MVPPTVHTGPAAAARLSELGLQFEHFEASFKYGLDQANTCTDKDAGFCKGVLLYSRIGRKLHELLEPADWVDSRPFNQKCVMNTELGVRILHLTGNAETGDSNPRTKVAPARPGGRARREIILQNTESTLLDGLDSSMYRKLRTWFLLYRLNSRTLRAELSYTETPPDDDGSLDWIERIVLPENELPEGLGIGDDALELPD